MRHKVQTRGKVRAHITLLAPVTKIIGEAPECFCISPVLACSLSTDRNKSLFQTLEAEGGTSKSSMKLTESFYNFTLHF